MIEWHTSRTVLVDVFINGAEFAIAEVHHGYRVEVFETRVQAPDVAVVGFAGNDQIAVPLKNQVMLA